MLQESFRMMTSDFVNSSFHIEIQLSIKELSKGKILCYLKIATVPQSMNAIYKLGHVLFIINVCRFWKKYLKDKTIRRELPMHINSILIILVS